MSVRDHCLFVYFENMKSEVIDSVKENLNKLVDAGNRQIEDRKRREII